MTSIMNSNSKISSLLLVGSLILNIGGHYLLVYFQQPIYSGGRLLFNILSSIVLFASYLWWMYLRRNLRSWLAPFILLGCALLTTLANTIVYQRAEAICYTRDQGMISEAEGLSNFFYTPEYAGEDTPLVLLIISPLAGFILLLFFSIRGQRGAQLLQYILLLFFIYPLTGLFLLNSCDSKPHYYADSKLPPDLAKLDSISRAKGEYPYRLCLPNAD
ncbi:hypothetical protein [Hymenobacter sp. UYP22]|uniref:hypothetical protein n=1 Tax=Hymenobacter sp. UYP22 TaxID=3156348 RepID=UPI003390BFE9